MYKYVCVNVLVCIYERCRACLCECMCACVEAPSCMYKRMYGTHVCARSKCEQTTTHKYMSK